MTKFFKTLLAVILSVVIMSLAGCFGDGTGNKTDDGDNNNINNQNEIEYKTKEQVAELLTNYHFELEIFVEDDDEEDEDTLIKITEIRCENGYYYALDGMAFIADFQGEKFYSLDIDNKTVFSTELDEEDKESFSDNSSATYLFSWHTYASYFDRAGTETILGRTCDVYEYDLTYHSEDFVYTYYVDQDLDICLKYEWSDSSENTSAYMRFTKFQLNGVTIEGILEILDEYEITDYSF